MKVQICSKTFLLIFVLLLVTSRLMINVEGGTCRPSGKIKGKKPPKGKCSNSECCILGKTYTTYKCSPKVSHKTKAILTLNSFEKGGDGGGKSECDKKFQSDNTPVVAFSTGWFQNGKICSHNITIFGNGRKVHAIVVDECDSTIGCDTEHGFQPPCINNAVDASPAVWKALGVKKSEWGLLDVYWSDA